MLILLRKKAQGTAEYVLLIAVAIGAMKMISGYTRKALANKVKATVIEYAGPGAGDTDTPYEQGYKSGTKASQTNNQSGGLGDTGALNVTSGGGAEQARVSGDHSSVTTALGGFNVAANTWDKVQ